MKYTVGIVTFHCSYNYGSMLQAVALQNYLIKHGYEAKIIDFVLEADFEQYKLFHTSYYKHGLKPFLSDILYFPVNYKRKKAFEGFKTEQMKLTPRRYTDAKQMRELNDQFDIFICGSDQIWNLECTGGIEPAFFLDFADSDKKKIAYAPSIANNKFDSVPGEELRRLLADFDALSVREKSTIPIVQPYSDREIVEVLDPTLLLEPEDYDSLLEGVTLCTDKPYIFMYILEPNAQIIEYVEQVSKNENLQIVYVSRKPVAFSHKAVNVYGVSPGAFLKYIQKAHYVITNSFHATVFSIQFARKFCTFKTAKSYARMCDLLEHLGLEQRVYAPGFDIQGEIDYLAVYEKLKVLRSGSEEFLRKAIYG